MTDTGDHAAWAAEAIAVFQRRCRTDDEHVIADLICDSDIWLRSECDLIHRVLDCTETPRDQSRSCDMPTNN
jgi:hypothetical protein